ncbi:MAG: hypothetical protein M3357_19700, partial [Actinomycetota bacterium]|nr:hypothetical protein [Actinomycetota bacterium]
MAADEVGGPPEAQARAFPGFTLVETFAQGQMATGYFFAVGDEENRLVGAVSTVNGPPAGSANLAAFVQRGVAASYMYGLAGGGGPGQAGILPQPPPGEAGAFFPAEPQEATWQGPVTAGSGGPNVVDGRFHAKATQEPTGVADAAVSAVEIPGYMSAEQAVVVSHTEPAADGVAAESVSVVRGLTIGPLRVESLVSRAYGLVPATPGEPKGVATTVLAGVTVNGTPVQVTDQGVIVGDEPQPGAQSQVNAALAQAGFSEISLTASSAAPGDNNESVRAMAGTLRVVHRDRDFGAQNPQGFSGGGFSVGGAEVSLLGRRCAPDCPDSGAVDFGSEPGLVRSDEPVREGEASAASTVPVASPIADFAIPGRLADSTEGIGSAFDSSSSSFLSPGLDAQTPYQPPEGASSTTAITPSAPAGASLGAAPLSRQQLALVAELDPRVGGWARDAFMALGAAMIAVVVAVS